MEPPYGHVYCCEKWRSSPLIQQLKGEGVQIHFDSELGTADFHLPNRSKVVYVSECDVISGNSYKKKLVRFRNASSSFLELVVVEKTSLGAQYFPAVQKFVSFDLGLPLLMVSGQAEAAKLIAQMVKPDDKKKPFWRKSECQLWDAAVLKVVQQVPGVGQVKALALLQAFPSIRELCNATPAQLEPVVGQACAQRIHSFFHSNLDADT